MSIFDAIQNNSLEEIKLLIAAGIDLEQRHRHSTPLDWAISYGRAEIAKELIDAGAKIYLGTLLDTITCQIACDEELEEYLPPTFAHQLRRKRQQYENLSLDSAPGTNVIAFLPETSDRN